MYKVVWMVGDVKNEEKYGYWYGAAKRAEELSKTSKTVVCVETYVNGVLIETEEFKEDITMYRVDVFKDEKHVTFPCSTEEQAREFAQIMAKGDLVDKVFLLSGLKEGKYTEIEEVKAW